jgi:Hexokinase
MHDNTASSSLPRESSWPFDLSWLPYTESYRTRHKLTPRPRVPLLYLLSALLFFFALGVQLLASRDTPPPPVPATQKYSPFGDSVYRQEAYYEQLEPGTQCKPKNPLSAELPTTPNMARRPSLADEVERLAAFFEYSAEDVNKGVKAFIQQMNEGLEKEGTMLSQIPTYVTAVPNGTEKVYPW